MGDLNNLYINYYLFINKNKKLSKSEKLSKNILMGAWYIYILKRFTIV